MSLLSAIILPALEKQLIAAEPAVAQFALKQLGSLATELMAYVESKGNKNSSSNLVQNEGLGQGGIMS